MTREAWFCIFFSLLFKKLSEVSMTKTITLITFVTHADITSLFRSHAEKLVDSRSHADSTQSPNSKWPTLGPARVFFLDRFSSQINSFGHYSIRGRTRLAGVELEKCGVEHGIR